MFESSYLISTANQYFIDYPTTLELSDTYRVISLSPKFESRWKSGHVPLIYLFIFRQLEAWTFFSEKSSRLLGVLQTRASERSTRINHLIWEVLRPCWLWEAACSCCAHCSTATEAPKYPDKPVALWCTWMHPVKSFACPITAKCRLSKSLLIKK